MANLKGKTFAKQANSIYYLLRAYGVSRHTNPDDRKTHSIELGKKRKMYLQDFITFSENLKLNGKLNMHMGNYTVVKDFLLKRIINLSKKTANDYISGISSLFTGLLLNNITISDDGFEAIEEIRDLVKVMPSEEFRTGRFIKNHKYVLNKLFEKNYESGVIAQVQFETGLRISEAYEFVENTKKYLFGNTIIGLIGKGRHIYEAKTVSQDLIKKLSGVEKLPTRHTYSKHLKLSTSNDEAIPHDWRITYVKIAYERKIAKGMLREEAFREISKEINHYRTEMTEYYLLRA